MRRKALLITAGLLGIACAVGYAAYSLRRGAAGRAPPTGLSVQDTSGRRRTAISEPRTVTIPPEREADNHELVITDRTPLRALTTSAEVRAWEEYWKERSGEIREEVRRIVSETYPHLNEEQRVSLIKDLIMNLIYPPPEHMRRSYYRRIYQDVLNIACELQGEGKLGECLPIFLACFDVAIDPAVDAAKLSIGSSFYLDKSGEIIRRRDVWAYRDVTGEETIVRNQDFRDVARRILEVYENLNRWDEGVSWANAAIEACESSYASPDSSYDSAYLAMMVRPRLKCAEMEIYGALGEKERAEQARLEAIAAMRELEQKWAQRSDLNSVQLGRAYHRLAIDQYMEADAYEEALRCLQLASQFRPGASPSIAIRYCQQRIAGTNTRQE